MSNGWLIAIILLVLGLIVSNIMLLKASAKLDIKKPNADIKDLQQQLKSPNEQGEADDSTSASNRQRME